MTTYRNSTYAFIDGLKRIFDEGSQVTVRGMKTLELRSQAMTILKPEERCFIIPKRNDNVFAKIAETLWMLRGRNDVTWLSHYLPRAPEFSDDGYNWRGGYGPRLRRFPGGYGAVTDQVKYVVDLLNKDPLSRQAVISIWDPATDTNPGKDIPCNNWIHFLIREQPSTDWNTETYDRTKTTKVLHMNVAQRSSDILWGFSGIDTFSWSVLHQIVAFCTGCKVGDLNYFISSWHLYERHWKRAEQILKAFPGTTIYEQGYRTAPFFTNLQELDKDLDTVFYAEEKGRNKEYVEVSIDDPLLFEMMDMLWLYNSGYEPDVLAQYINTMHPHSDFRLAAIEHFARKFPILLDSLTTSPAEQLVISSALVV